MDPLSPPHVLWTGSRETMLFDKRVPAQPTWTTA